MSGDLTEVGTGVNLFVAGEVRGVARWFNDTSDVLSIDDDDLVETIAFVNKGGMTFLSPILPDLRASCARRAAASRTWRSSLVRPMSHAWSSRTSRARCPTVTPWCSTCPTGRRPASRPRRESRHPPGWSRRAHSPPSDAPPRRWRSSGSATTPHPGLNFTDLDRERRQQAFIASLAVQLSHAGTFTDPARLSALIGVATQNIAVDPGLDLLTLAVRPPVWPRAASPSPRCRSSTSVAIRSARTSTSSIRRGEGDQKL